MPSLRLFAALIIAVALSETCSAQTATLAVPSYRTRYKDLKLWHEKSLVTNSSPSARLEYCRHLVRSKYGQRGLDSLFRNFEGQGAIDPTIPGVEKNIRLCVSDNTNVAKGARRTQLYANRIHNDPRFRLVGLDTLTDTPIGKTDKDITYRHRQTGVAGRIEVKQWSIETQRTNFRSLKKQIQKMAISQRQTGELQSLMFRGDVIPKVRTYAARFGIPVYDNVATGTKTSRLSTAVPIEGVLNDLDRRATVVGRTRMVAGGASLGIGLVTTFYSGKAAFSELERLASASPTNSGSSLRFGRHASLALSGIGMTVRGGADLGKLISASTRNARVLTVSARVAGGVAIAAFLVSEGFLIAEYLHGDMTTREFTSTQAALGGGLAGALAGAGAGAKAGAFIGVWVGGPPGAALGGSIGAVVGGVGGSFAGAAVAQRGINEWYSFRDAKVEREFRDFVFTHYGASNRR